jgi:conjugal transfer/type IV secretion protein DotA/TraY
MFGFFKFSKSAPASAEEATKPSRFRKVAGEVTGLKPLMQGFSGATSIFVGGAKLLGNFYSLLSMKEGAAKVIPEDVSDRSKRFEIAAKAYGVDDAEWRRQIRATHNQFLLRCALLTLYAAYFVISAKEGWIPTTPLVADSLYVPGLMTLAYLCPFAIILLLIAKVSFANWQFRTRSLGDPRDLLRDPAAWWTHPEPNEVPPTQGNRPRKRAASIAPSRSVTTASWIVFAISCALLPLTADAQGGSVTQSAGPMSTPAGTLPMGDLGYGILQRLFPEIIGLPGNAVTQAVAKFNSALLVLSTLVLSWHTLAGMVATAHEGKVLGSRWHQIWAPLRVSFGVSMLVPVKGFCVAQIVVVYVLASGFALANSIWAVFISAVVPVDPKKGEYSIIVAAPPGVHDDLVLAIVEKELCVSYVLEVGKYEPTILNIQSIDMYYPRIFGTPARLTDRPNYEGETKNNSQIWEYGAVCGEISIQRATHPKPFLGSPKPTTQSTAEAAFKESQIAAMKELIRDIRSAFPSDGVAKSFLAGRGTNANDTPSPESVLEGMRNSLSTARTSYQTAMRNAATVYYDAIDRESRIQFNKQATELGWVSAGTMYWTVSRISALIASKSSEKAEIEEMSLEGLNKQHSEILKMFQQLLRHLWSESVHKDPQIPRTTVAAGDPNLDGTINRFISDAFRSFSDDQFNIKNEGFPMSEMVNWGHKLLNWGWGIIIALFGLAVVGLAKDSTMVGAALGFVANVATGGMSAVLIGAFNQLILPLMMGVVMTLFVVGAFYAYVLPVMIGIMWLFLVIGIILFCCEAVIAASLWAFSHVRMDGSDLIDNAQRAGYVILFNGFLRPSLALMGFILGMTTFSIGIWLLNTTFNAMVQGAQIGNFIGLVGWIVNVILLCFLHWQLAVRSFSLCHLIPDRVSQWFGAHGSNLGEEQDFGSAKGFVGGIVTGKLAGGVGQMAGGIGRLPGAVKGIQQAREAETENAAKKAAAVKGIQQAREAETENAAKKAAAGAAQGGATGGPGGAAAGAVAGAAGGGGKDEGRN